MSSNHTAAGGPITAFANLISDATHEQYQRWHAVPAGQRPSIPHPSAAPVYRSLPAGEWDGTKRVNQFEVEHRAAYRASLAAAGRAKLPTESIDLLWDEALSFLRSAPWVMGHWLGAKDVANCEAEPDLGSDTKARAAELNKAQQSNWEASYARAQHYAALVLDLAARVGECADPDTVPSDDPDDYRDPRKASRPWLSASYCWKECGIHPSALSRNKAAQNARRKWPNGPRGYVYPWRIIRDLINTKADKRAG